MGKLRNDLAASCAHSRVEDLVNEAGGTLLGAVYICGHEMSERMRGSVACRVQCGKRCGIYLPWRGHEAMSA